ncbi:cyclic pyranopterin monophosphate synthase MoaC [Aquibacillus koreensis]|uniref:Cyclic pyranopterin monophosphate synthase n=1 Tax=Aquibacillus koreensis TaxID=279446 RepID=A0A9X3WMB6_9BACI|nr:cyclic pyranopterin monophosphate synthase MoaC [Aquibacillus koreensis]MCT2536803.1 cyclic pyranopterin monophosphate synthase MoaC [Aquibacillus koreensis]MDC3421440.1 cyclic pyranopterin monophosphate synthase MoaC [Aquibacillus koreensis]
MSEFTHMNQQGRAKMVDITDKTVSSRRAIARSSIIVLEEIYQKITNHKMGKGDVLAVAQVAGVMAAKQTSTIIPMCHPLALSGVNILFDWVSRDDGRWELVIDVEVKTKGSTGVEMEALTAASVTALTIYDMCKAVDKGMIIGQTYLLEKSGGKSGAFKRTTDNE